MTEISIATIATSTISRTTPRCRRRDRPESARGLALLPLPAVRVDRQPAQHDLEARMISRRRQRGVVLLIVLVAMVAMLISVIALSRSMDTNQSVAGNLAFRNAAVHSTDAGVQGAVAWLQGTVGTAQLNTNAPDRGYFAQLAEPNWDEEALWSQCAACRIAADGAGNRIEWVIHRMCSAQGNPNDAGVSCSLLTAGSSAASGGSYNSDATNFAGVAQNYYRVTVRVQGPRNTNALIQTFVSL
jgi:Tfp pilus assembly protein PilX